MKHLHDAEQDRRIDYVELAATSIPDTKRFYRNQLLFREMEERATPVPTTEES